MADPTSFRPSRTRLRWLRATGLVVVLGALVPPSSWAAEALGLRWEVSAGGLEVFADPVLGWEQLVRRCETWVHVFVDQGVRVRVWDQTRSTISELDPGVAHWEIGAGGRVSTTPR